MSSTTKAYLQLHIAVILWGFTAILGKWITLPALDLVWWRVGITSLSLLPIVLLRKKLANFTLSDWKIYGGIGIIVGLHWLCFYGSIKLANASVSLVCMGTASFFASIFEPIVFRKPINKLDLSLGLIIIPAMFLVVSGLDEAMIMGAVVGLLSAALAALFSVLNKKYIDNASPYTITFVELGVAWVFLGLIMLYRLPMDMSYIQLPADGRDWWLLVVLSLVCTTLTFVLSLKALKYISAFVSTLIINLEPVYGIALAAILLGEYEELTPSFYIGALVILIAVLVYPSLQRRFSVIR